MELKVDSQIINYMKIDDEDYISITDMLKSKDGNFFVTDWLRNRNTLEFCPIYINYSLRSVFGYLLFVDTIV